MMVTRKLKRSRLILPSGLSLVALVLSHLAFPWFAALPFGLLLTSACFLL